MSERKLVIRCLDCQKDENTPWLPLTYSASCGECAQTSVANHLLEHPGHRCEVLGSAPEESKDTQRLLGKAQGW